MVYFSLLRLSFQCLSPTCFSSDYLQTVQRWLLTCNQAFRLHYAKVLVIKPPKCSPQKPTSCLYNLCSAAPLEVQGLFLGSPGKELRKGSLPSAHTESLNRVPTFPRKLLSCPQIKRVEITGLLYSCVRGNVKKKEKWCKALLRSLTRVTHTGA